MTEDWLFFLFTGIIIGYFSCGVPLGAFPPKKEWVGLTDEEISLIDWKLNETLHDYARAIEAKLKEKTHD